MQTWSRRCDSAVPARKTGGHHQRLLYTPGNGRINPGFAFLDYAGPLIGKMFLIVVDAHSKWIGAFQMNTSTSSATIEKLRIAFATHGLPEIVVTDNGSNFVSREFEDFLKQNGIRHIRIAPYHPVSNGMAERAVQTFKEGMKKMNEGSVETLVSRFLARYRITPQTSTGVSPAELLLGRKTRSRLDLVYPKIGRRVRQSQASQKLAHDWHAKERTIQEGEAVYASNFRSGPKWMPGVLKQSTGPASFSVQLEDGRLLRRHQDHLIPRSNVIQEPIADQEVPPQQAAEQLELQPEELLTQPTEPVQSAPQDISEKRYPTRNRQAPRYLADFVTKSLVILQGRDT